LFSMVGPHRKHVVCRVGKLRGTGYVHLSGCFLFTLAFSGMGYQMNVNRVAAGEGRNLAHGFLLSGHSACSILWNVSHHQAIDNEMLYAVALVPVPKNL